jgi:hypothetical protein
VTHQWPAASVTGHRDLSDAQMSWLRPELDRVNLKLVADHGTTDAATGMALKADQDFGWSALFAKMRLHAMIPFPEQPDGWSPEEQASYRRLLEQCTTKTVFGPSYAVKWLFVRNDGLLDFTAERGGAVVAVWDGRREGGTFDTVRKAARRGLPVIHLDVAGLRTHGPGCSCVTRLAVAGEPKLF